MTTKVIIKHDGTSGKEKNLLISRRYADPKKKGSEALYVLRPGLQISAFTWPGAIIEIKEEV